MTEIIILAVILFIIGCIGVLVEKLPNKFFKYLERVFKL